MFIWFLRIAALLFMAMLIVRVLHFILPDEWLWLDEDQVQSMDNLLFSGTLGGLVVKYLSPIIGVEK